MTKGSEPVRRSVRRVEVDGFTLIEGVHPGGSALPWHTHETPTICCVLEGGFTEISQSSSLTCAPSTIKFMPAGDRHRDQFEYGPAHGLLIEVGKSAEVLGPCGSILNRQHHLEGGQVWNVVLRLMGELQVMDTASPLAIEGLMLELLAGAARLDDRDVQDKRPRWLQAAQELIEAQLATSVELATIATASGVHPVTLARGFRRAFGCTLGEYIRRRRIERAIQQLRTSSAPLAEIALANGFADQSHFSNLFRRYTGVTPSRFRRAAWPV